MRRVACVLVSSLLVLIAAGARAEMEEWQISVGPGYRGVVLDSDPALAIHAPGVSFGAWYGIDDYWQLGGGGHAGLGIPVATEGAAPDPAFVGSLGAEVRYVLDIVEWVPHLAVAIGGMWNGVGELGAFDLIVGGGLGIDYRPAREWSVGLSGRYDVALTDLDGISATFHVALVYSLHLSSF
ncbi:MAG: hypothetical protein IT385_18575 [Deltaproteobacteria bacterium]|nr:hypothetical protein [Deltaproteobacteria bacterium]